MAADPNLKVWSSRYGPLSEVYYCSDKIDQVIEMQDIAKC
jgi:hypothetical protein